MYQALKNNTVQYLLDYKPTPEQLAELGCDSYEVYEESTETPEQQKARIKESITSTPDISSVDLEGVTFSDTEIGDIIQARVFGGNPHAESALQAKISGYLMSVISGNPNEEMLTDILNKQAMVNEVREKFNLTPITT